MANIVSTLIQIIFMKHFFLLPTLLVAFAAAAYSQSCTPDTMLPDSVIVSPLPYQDAFPERGLQDTACVGSFFETTIQVNIPPTIAFAGTEIAIVNVSVTTGITNLPASMNYACNPPNCVFLPMTTGCINLYGTPVAGEEGVRDLKIAVLVNAGLQLPFNLPDGNLVPGNYFLTVRPSGDAACLVNTNEVVENAFGLQIAPNPLTDAANITVDAPESGDYQLRVFNVLGTLVQSRTIGLANGTNTFTFDGSTLPVGMYVFSLQHGDKAASGRLMIQR